MASFLLTEAESAPHRASRAAGPLGDLRSREGFPGKVSSHSTLHLSLESQGCQQPPSSLDFHLPPCRPLERAAGPWQVTTSACACPPSPQVTVCAWLVASKPPDYDTWGTPAVSWALLPSTESGHSRVNPEGHVLVVDLQNAI